MHPRRFLPLSRENSLPLNAYPSRSGFARALVCVCVQAVIAGTALSASAQVATAAAMPATQDSSSMLHVSGLVHFGAQKARMTHVYFRQEKSDDGPVLALLFSDHPLAARALDDRQKLAELARSRTFVGLLVHLDRSGSIVSTDLYHDDGSFSGPWRFEPTTGKSANTAGRIATDEERDFFGKPYSVDVAFKVGPKADETWRGSPFYETQSTGLSLGRAEGEMERLRKKTKLTHALAVSETDLFGDSGERKLFLSEKPITDDMLTTPRGLEHALHGAGISFLRISFDGQNEITSVMVLSEDGTPMNFSSSHSTLEFSAGPATELDGRTVLKGAKDSDPEFPRFDIRFHAAVRTIGAAPVTASNGQPLPKGGGAPGKAYQAFLTALKKAQSFDELIPLRTAPMATMIHELPPEQRGTILEFMKQEAQTPHQIVGGFANDDQATLWLEGRNGDQRSEGRVQVHREAGSWKLGLESYRILSDPKP